MVEPEQHSYEEPQIITQKEKAQKTRWDTLGKSIGRFVILDMPFLLFLTVTFSFIALNMLELYMAPNRPYLLTTCGQTLDKDKITVACLIISLLVKWGKILCRYGMPVAFVIISLVYGGVLYKRLPKKLDDLSSKREKAEAFIGRLIIFVGFLLISAAITISFIKRLNVKQTGYFIMLVYGFAMVVILVKAFFFFRHSYDIIKQKTPQTLPRTPKKDIEKPSSNRGHIFYGLFSAAILLFIILVFVLLSFDILWHMNKMIKEELIEYSPAYTGFALENKADLLQTSGSCTIIAT